MKVENQHVLDIQYKFLSWFTSCTRNSPLHRVQNLQQT